MRARQLPTAASDHIMARLGDQPPLYLARSTVVVLRWRWRRDVNSEASGATHKTFQEMREEPFSTVSRNRYCLPSTSQDISEAAEKNARQSKPAPASPASKRELV